MLKGKKVFLRPLRKADISLFLKWFNDQEVLKYQLRYLPLSEMAGEKWLDEVATNTTKSSVHFIIEAIKGTASKPIGHCVLRDINHRDQNAIFGIGIGEKDCWGKGCGAEATQLLIDYGFKQLNLYRISAHVSEFNERSMRMHRLVGFQEEGRLRKARFKDGKFGDDIIYGVLRDEWKKQG